MVAATDVYAGQKLHVDWWQRRRRARALTPPFQKAENRGGGAFSSQYHR